MVSHVAVSRPHFKRTNRQVVVGVGRKDEDLVLVGHVPAVVVRFRHGKHHVRSADLASFRKGGDARIVRRIAFGFALGHPIA